MGGRRGQYHNAKTCGECGERGSNVEEERCRRFFWRSLSHCLAVLEVESGGGGGMIKEFPDTEEENSERATL